MIGAKRTVLAVSMSILLVAAAVTSVWLMVSAGVFRPSEARLVPVSSSGEMVAGPDVPGPGLGAFTVSQPRDPFRPLIIAPPTTTTPTDTTQPGETTTTVPGQTTTTVPGQTTTTSPTDTPGAVRVMLNEIRTEDGVRVAVVTVDGVAYTVKVGDIFADAFQVVSLSDNGGVFTYEGNAFTLAVGQSILK
jgi:hypothetical protein